MRRGLCTLLLTALCAVLMTGAARTAPNTAESEPVLLGTEEEYQSTFKTMFDENGLRKVEVGFHSDAGILNNKVGLVDRYGVFAVQPIYDEIKLYSFLPALGSQHVTVLPKLFVGGYTQAKRDGKMGLLNVRGEEVVPCQYDFVGLPAEGMCRVLKKKSGDMFYLGYWDLTKKREAVAPDRYITTYENLSIGPVDGAYTDALNAVYSRRKPDGDYCAVNDFIDGYAMVFTSKQNTNKTISATVIDRNGKEVLKQSCLVIDSFPKYSTYPQKGPYLSFVAPLTIKDRAFVKKGDRDWRKKLTFETYGTGLAGPEGTLIEPIYTTGIKASPGEVSFSINHAEFEILPQHRLILTSRDAQPGFLYGTGYGAVDFSGRTVIPFENTAAVVYNANENVLVADGTLYTPACKVIARYDGTGSFFVNGIIKACRFGAYNTKDSYTPTTLFYVKPDGASLNVTELLHCSLDQTDPATRTELSDFSTGGFAWVRVSAKSKWGLIDFRGRTVLPFDYDKVGYVKWAEGDNGYAVVEKNGKEGLVNAQGRLVASCSYKKISPVLGSRNTPAVQVTDFSGKKGVIDIKTGKVLLPFENDAVGAFGAYDQPITDWFEMGVYHVTRGDRTMLIDANGAEVYSTPYSKTKNTHLNFVREASNGLYGVYAGSMDNRGRIIIPVALTRSSNLEVGDSYTIMVKDKKVYRISANYLESTFGFKTSAPGISSQAALEYAMSKKDEFQKALEKARNKPSQQKKVRSQPIVQFQHTPAKLLYRTGEAFAIEGFRAVYLDIYDNSTDVTKDIVLKVGSAALSDGDTFTQAGQKTVDCYYKGKKLNNFKISIVRDKEDESGLLADGDYHMQIFGRYIAPVYAGGTFYMELSDKKPSKPFTVKLVRNDSSRGPLYNIRYDGTYVMQPTSRDGAQLMTSNGIPHQWRIDQSGSFCTIRDYGKQQLIVNASGNRSANGTKVIVWTVKGSAPENAKVAFVKAE